MYLLTYIDRVNVSTASNLLEKELHLDKTQVGFVFSAFGYPYLIFQIIGGYLGDRFGPRKVLTICSLIWALATMLTGLAGGFFTMILARLLLGFGEGATFPTATSAMSVWTKPSDRGFAQGFTHAGARIGNSVTPALVVALMAVSGWRGSFLVLGGISCLWVLIWFIFYRDDPAKHFAISQAEIAGLPSYVNQAERRRHPVPWVPCRANAAGELIKGGWHDQEVKESMDLCLACKGCKSECPTNVDIATYKSEFLSHYYEGRPRPLNHYAFGFVDRWARLGSFAPKLINSLNSTPGLNQIAKAVLQVAPQREIPKCAEETFVSWAKKQPSVTGSRGEVVLFADTFNNYFRPKTARAAWEVLHSAGFTIHVPQT
jgi:ferredoxin